MAATVVGNGTFKVSSIGLEIVQKPIPTLLTFDATTDLTVTFYTSNVYVDVLIDWGDGTTPTAVTGSGNALNHTYATAGVYVAEILSVGVGTDMTWGSNNTLTEVSGPLPVNMASDLEDMFLYCTSLATVSSNVFDNYLDTTVAEKVFQYSGITTIPDAFKKLTKVTNILSAFYGTSITTIPVGLLDNMTDLLDVSGLFGDTLITSIPEDLFKYNTKITDFATTFRNYRGTTIPAGLFKYNTLAENFNYTFYVSDYITEVPVDLFRYNTLAKYFNNTFNQCDNLDTIPTDMFAYNSIAEEFDDVLYQTAITMMPDINATNNPLANSFRYALARIETFRGNVPELWLEFPSADGYNCFFNTDNAANYADIPTDWK